MWTPGGQIDHLTFAGMRGGGKGKSPPPAAPVYTDPQTGKSFNDPTSLNTEIDQRTQAATDAANAQAATDAATAAANEQTFQGNRQSAYQNALQQAIQAFSGAGVDPNAYMSNYITPQLQSALGSIPDLAPNPATYFPAGLGQSILNQATSDRRTQLGNAVNSIFTPNYATNLVPDSVMTQPIADMLSQKFDPLMSQLTNAQKRGTLTDVGYQAALDKLGQDKSAAQSQLQTLGQNILTSDRSALGDIATSARNDAAGANLGTAFDPSSYATRGSTLAGQDVSGFGGALQNAAGNVQFSDIQSLLNAGGSVQGANNPTAANPGGGVATTLPQQGDTRRGLGTTGAF